MKRVLALALLAIGLGEHGCASTASTASTAPAAPRAPRETPPATSGSSTPRPIDRPPADAQAQPATTAPPPSSPVAPPAAAPPPALVPSPSTPSPGATPPLDPIQTARGIHDPAIIREGDWFYCFSTGSGLPIHRSRDLVFWEPVGRVFQNDVPPWAKQEIPTSVNVWAPDIALVDGRYVLSYTVATFGQNRSLIGMASTPTLDPAARGYRWRNDGKVVESFVGDDFNAIDSNLFVEDGRAVVFFGSYWTGIKMVELDRATLKPRDGAERVSVARREADGGIEAPFVVRRDGWYYMFLSFDKCCAGVDSTYNVRVGRSRALEGPYYDRQNTPMTRGGGTRVLETDGRMIGPGHCCVFEDGGRWYIGYHFYDRDSAGVPTLQVRELLWDHLGWPRVGAAVGGE